MVANIGRRMAPPTIVRNAKLLDYVRAKCNYLAKKKRVDEAWATLVYAFNTKR